MGDNAITKRRPVVERDKVLSKLNAPMPETVIQQVASTRITSFCEIAEM